MRGRPLLVRKQRSRRARSRSEAARARRRAGPLRGRSSSSRRHRRRDRGRGGCRRGREAREGRGREAREEVSERLAALARDSSKAPRCEDSGDCGYFEQCINSRCVGATLDEEQIETRSFAAAVAWAQRKQASSPYRRWLTSRDVRKTDAAGAQWETASELNRMTSLLRRQLQGGVYSYFYFPWDFLRADEGAECRRRRPARRRPARCRRQRRP